MYVTYKKHQSQEIYPTARNIICKWEMPEKDKVMLSGTHYLPILTYGTRIRTWTKRYITRLYTAVSTKN
jgi:hypothetical protein